MYQLNWYQIFGNTHTIPDGRTVTPTDDIQIWLNCAGIFDKAYTKLAEVLADTTTLSALMASDNAVDYLVRSTTWAVPITVPIMTSNTTPSGVCIASSEDYPAYYAFNGNTSNGWASVAVGTSNLGRVGYEFTEAVDIKKVSLLHGNNANFTCKVQYSDDGVNWTDVEDSTFTAVKNTQANVSFDAGSHLYWAVYYLSASASTRASVNELQFYSASITTSADAMTAIGNNNYAADTLLADATWCEAICKSDYWQSVLNAKNPDMTSNTAPSGVASANGNYTDYYPWKALDGNDNTSWASPSTASLSDWLKYEFADDGIIIKRIRIKSSRYQTYKIQVSNDNANWADLYSGVTGDVSTYIENTTRYKYIKYVPTSLVGGVNSGSISEFKVYGRKDV